MAVRPPSTVNRPQMTVLCQVCYGAGQQTRTFEEREAVVGTREYLDVDRRYRV